MMVTQLKDTLATLLEIARHELMVVLRTRRAVVIASLYLGAAILGGLIYVAVLRFGEQKALDFFVSQGTDPDVAAQNMELAQKKIYHELARWLAGVDNIEQVAASWRDSVILPVFFWCSLALMPFLIIFTSFDQLSADLNVRSLCYSILRVRRSAILLGKILAYTIIFMVLSGIGSAVLVFCASLLLETVEFVPSLWGLFRIWLLLIPFGLCYLAITSFCSAINTQPVPSLVSAVAVVIGLWVLGLLRFVPEQSDWSFLRFGRFLAPGTYEDGMWLVGFQNAAGSAFAYLIFALIFILLGIWRLRARDL